ncbi:MAG: lipocalin family protein [Reichenbachiella sp.]|uniref:lipocalin family protein n=1 Tax=Reichenbachiella sp. TaxID=2184521 RepID=UPI003264BAB2
MKHLLHTTLFAFSLIVISSCSSDDPEPDKIIGTWIMDNATYFDAPSGYSLSNGEVENLYGENEYKIRFFDDLTYERDIAGNGGSFEDEGTWVQEGDDLTLTYDKGTTGLLLEFTVEGEITDKNLDITSSTSVRTFSDEILNDPETFDTITTQSSIDDIIETYSEVINLKVTLSFDKE